jgi:hypothetical protein
LKLRVPRVIVTLAISRGMLTLIEISDARLSFAKALEDAQAKYGKPIKQETSTTWNAFGAKVDTGHARSDMPDGVVLTIDELNVALTSSSDQWQSSENLSAATQKIHSEEHAGNLIRSQS